MNSAIFNSELQKVEASLQKQILTVEEAASYVKLTKEEMESLINNGEIGFRTIAGTKRIASIDLAAWISNYKEKTDTPLDNMLTSALPSLHLEDIEEAELEMVKREKGLGSVYYNDKRKCWQAAFYMIENGEKKRKVISAKTQDEVIINMSQIRSGKMAFTSEEEMPIRFREKHKIVDIWHYILEKQRKNRCTSRTYRWYVDIGRHIEKGFKDKCIEDLTSNDIQEFLNSKVTNDTGKKYSDKTIKEISFRLKRICSYAFEEGYIKKNPYNENI